MAGLGPRRVVRGVFYLLNGIAHGHGEARAATSGYKTGTVFGCDRAALRKLLSPLFSFSTKKTSIAKQRRQLKETDRHFENTLTVLSASPLQDLACHWAGFGK